MEAGGSGWGSGHGWEVGLGGGGGLKPVQCHCSLFAIRVLDGDAGRPDNKNSSICCADWRCEQPLVVFLYNSLFVAAPAVAWQLPDGGNCSDVSCLSTRLAPLH